MDIFSHSLWGGVALGRNKKKDFILAAVFSILPDMLAEGIMFLLIYIGIEGLPSFEHGHPNITEFPLYAQNFYNTTHSLVVFAALFGIVWLILRKPYMPLLAWAIHILIDIPSHSFELFPTPFLWPVSDYKFDGISWRNPEVLYTNFALLAVVYVVWFWRWRKKKSENTIL